MKGDIIMLKYLYLIVFLLLFSGLAYGETRDPYTWVPNGGFVDTSNTDTEGLRNIYFSYWYYDESRLTGLMADNNETLEMDVVIYNYDDNAWAHHYPTGAYWETNQPAAYLDTQLDDKIYERAFTVGVADANQLIAGRSYYWFTEAIGYGNSSLTKISAQRGYRNPSNVYNAYSVFPEQTEIIVPFSQNFSSPGYLDWNY